MKKTLFILFFAFVSQMSAQKYMTRNAEVHFLSDKESVEVVEALNTQVGAVIDLEKGAIAFQIQMRAFHFEIALMEEHFNENYVETELYPKATFSGVFKKLPTDLSIQQELVVVGTIDFHGVQKEMEIPVSIVVKEGVLQGDAKFNLRCSDFNIEIPKIVSDKLANTIQVSVKASLNRL